jgi:5'(3')-deoxyribonucleotidase
MRQRFHGALDNVPDMFALMDPIEGAIGGFKQLSQLFDTYILSTAPWENSSAWRDKNVWVRKYLGVEASKRLILSHHKHLNTGDFLIDDRHNKNGVDKFRGELIHFGPGNPFPTWNDVVNYLKTKV